MTITGGGGITLGTASNQAVEGDRLVAFDYVLTCGLSFGSAVGANTYLPLITGGSVASGTAGTVAAQIFRLESADFALAGTGRVTKMQTRLQTATGSTAPACNFTLSLFPITISGNVVYTVGAAVTGSGCTITAPAASSANTALSGAFTIPANGYYGLAVANSASTAALSTTLCSCQLQKVYA